MSVGLRELGVTRWRGMGMVPAACRARGSGETGHLLVVMKHLLEVSCTIQYVWVPAVGASCVIWARQE